MIRPNLNAIHEPSRPKYGETHISRFGAGTWAKPKITRNQEDDPARASAVEAMMAKIRQRKQEV